MSAHNHSHDHHTENKKILLISFAVIASFRLVETAAGWLSNSLALISDAASLALALLAFK
ncbi:hypothetical protein QDY71_06115 [Kingella negevensis]|uniref:Cadmium, cobalt and zinc/H(+)-K(+) antiporter n=1 Tax=Kingella negevensis TaxID=1522312 RepID=A0A238TAP2_9NEIS|nr:hypothetical protein [Kingella negevensis]MDK4697331.1 hypothetical protein [Kingella negevensis]SNB70225.1 Cadmium, cobalt and zinc/H(+)-K(+) antiporter [Kingella negevensis]